MEFEYFVAYLKAPAIEDIDASISPLIEHWETDQKSYTRLSLVAPGYDGTLT
jgi:hypothetical protein